MHTTSSAKHASSVGRILRKKGSAQRINVVVIRKITSISVVDDRLKADCMPRVVPRLKLTVNTVLRGTFFGETEF